MRTTPTHRCSARERPARAPGARGWRCFGWLGALVLCAVLASAGMPARRGAIADGARIEACLDAAHVLPHAAARAPLPVRPDIAFAVTQPPRPRARTLAIADGGLPPPRAPTV